MATNPNPVVYRGPCRICGEEVALFEKDAEDYLRDPVGGLVHLSCPCPVCGGPHSDHEGEPDGVKD